MSKIIKLYCEGVQGYSNEDSSTTQKSNASWDKQLLEKLNVGVTIVPIGSKKGAGEAILAENQYAVDKFDYYFFFRDRDFDKDLRTLDKETLFIEDKKNNKQEIIGQWCFSYRTTIENYLFDYEHFFNFLTSKKKDIVESKNLHTPNDVKKLFIKVAEKLKFHQAVRHTLGEMRERTDFGTNIKGKKSGDLPQDYDSEIFCKEEALNAIKKSKSKVDTKWTEEVFEEKFNNFLIIFNNSEFFEKMKFLIWFQGKDFATALRKELGSFSEKDMDSYYNYSLKHFKYTDFPDLVELRNLLLEKMKEV